MNNVTNVEQYVLDKRKELDGIETKWNKLSKEFKDKVTKLVASGIKPSISRGNSSGRQLSVSVNFESNTDAAKKYVEETRVALDDMIERIKSNTAEAGKMVTEGDYNNKEKLALIKLFLEYMHFIETAEFDAGKSKITFEIAEETIESKKKVLAIEKEIKDTEEAKRLGVDVKDLANHKKYLEAKRKYNTAKTSGAFLQAAKLFNDIKSYKDAATLAEDSTIKGNELKAKETYQRANEFIQKDTIESLEKAITTLEEIKDYLDSNELIVKCNTRIQEIKDEIIRNTYKEAEAYFNEKTINSLKRAIPLYEQIIDYKDSKEKIEYSNKLIQELVEEEERIRKENIYISACMLMDNLNEEDFNKAIDKFTEIKDYKDSKDKIKECKSKIEELKNEGLYQEVLFAISQGTKASYLDAIVVLKELKDYKDCKNLLNECTQKVKFIEEKEEQARIKAEEERKEQERKQEEEKKAKEKKKKSTMRLVSIVSIIIIVITIALPYYNNTLKPTLNYNKAISLLEENKHDEAIEIFTNLGTFKDSEDMIIESKYQKAMYCYETKDYETAITLFEELGYYENSSSMEAKARHDQGQQYFNTQQYNKAVEVLSSVKNSSESKELYTQSAYQLGLQQFEQGLYEEGYETLWSLRYNLDTATETAQELYYQQALKFYDELDFEKSNPMFKKLGSYKDSPLLIHNHNFKSEVLVELTCEQNGEVKQTCECGTEEIVITEATGHEMVEATCTEPKHCKKCDLVEGEALGHDVVDDVCARCGANLMEPAILTGKTSSYTEKETTLTLPQGLYEFEITTKLNKKDRWSVKIEGTEIFFGYGAATSNGTFKHEVETRNAGDYRIVVKINGEYTLKITPKN